MGSQQSKCKSLYLPAQSGKTRKMEELIKEYKLGELFDPVDINIIISANNRLLVEQTKTRMKKTSEPRAKKVPATHASTVQFSAGHLGQKKATSAQKH